MVVLRLLKQQLHLFFWTHDGLAERVFLLANYSMIMNIFINMVVIQPKYDIKMLCCCLRNDNVLYNMERPPPPKLDLMLLIGSGQVYTGQTVDQIDMAATLALLLGVPIPQNNLGTIIVPMLNELDSRDKLRALYSNAKQLLMVMQENVRDYKRG